MVEDNNAENMQGPRSCVERGRSGEPGIQFRQFVDEKSERSEFRVSAEAPASRDPSIQFEMLTRRYPASNVDLALRVDVLNVLSYARQGEGFRSKA